MRGPPLSPPRPPRRLHPALVVLIVFLALVPLVLVVAVVAAFNGFLDPTEQTFSVTLRNDTSSTVVLKQCDVDCSSFHSVFRLVPGRTAAVNTSSWGADNWWVVADQGGRTLGCLDLLFYRKETGVIVDVSGYGRCPGQPRSGDVQQAEGDLGERFAGVLSGVHRSE